MRHNFTVGTFAFVILLGRSAAAGPMNVPVLHGPYTLTFSASFHRAPPSLIANNKGGDFSAPGRVTLSSDGSILLYIMTFGAWRNIVIYDSKRSLAYEYDNSGRNSQYMPGADEAYAAMHYIPFPAVGVDEFPLLQSVSCGPGAAGCSGSLAYLGSTMAGPGSFISNTPTYIPNSPVVFGQWNGTPVVTACEVFLKPKPSHTKGGTMQRWRFSRFMAFEGVPIAQKIQYEENRDRKQGQMIEVVADSEATYTLVASSPRAMPPDAYKMETYLKTSNSVDAHISGKDTTFSFDPRGGSLDEQRSTALRAADKNQPDKDNGAGSNRNRTGVFAAIALLFGGLAWAVWRRRK